MKRLTLWISAIVIVALVISAGMQTIPTYAEGGDTDNPAVNVSITGTIATITTDMLTLTDGTAITLNAETTGITADVKVGVVVTVIAELGDDVLVAKSVSLGTTTADDSTTGSTSTNGKAKNNNANGNGNGNKGKGKNNSAAVTATPAATVTAAPTESVDSGNGNGKGKGNVNNGMGNGKGNKGKGNDDKKDDEDNGNKDNKGNSAKDKAACLANTSQPVARRLSTIMGVSYSQIMAWHCDGVGFGNIARAYLLSKKTNMTVDQIIALHKSGKGWGKIIKDLGLHPGDFAPGQLLGGGKSGKNSD